MDPPTSVRHKLYMRWPEALNVLPFGVTDTEFALVTFLSAFVGISLVVWGSLAVKTRYLAAFALGVYLWFFTDTLSGANYLDDTAGFVYSPYLASLVALFVLGLTVFFAFDGKMFTTGGSLTRGALAVGALVAVAMGLHGMAEGAAFGTTAAQTPSSSLIPAFGGFAASVSWVFHKMTEPTVAAVAYVAVAGPGSRKPSDRVVDALILAAVFVFPAIVGSVAGYATPFDVTYIYALGLGTSVYALARVARGLYSEGSDSWLSVKMALAAVLGFLCLFSAALLHS